MLQRPDHTCTCIRGTVAAAGSARLAPPLVGDEGPDFFTNCSGPLARGAARSRVGVLAPLSTKASTSRICPTPEEPYMY